MEGGEGCPRWVKGIKEEEPTSLVAAHEEEDPMSEAAARVKINKLLEEAGWRFFAEDGKPANIRLEPSVTIKAADLDGLGDDFEKASKGFIDFLLLDERGFPLIVLEAKSEEKNPLVGKEQARRYARSQNCRFVILSNGNLHYFWDLEHGNPGPITAFPTPDSASARRGRSAPRPQASDRRAGGARLHRPHPAAELRQRGRLEERERARRIQASQQAALSAPYQLTGGPRAAKAVKEAAIASCSRWPQARARPSPPPPSSSCSCARATPDACSSWWTGWNSKSKHSRRSGICFRRTARLSSTNRTATTGGAPKLS